MKRVLKDEDGFVWHVLTQKEARLAMTIETVYAIYSDGTQIEIKNESDVERHHRRGAYICTEVGYEDDDQN